MKRLNLISMILILFILSCDEGLIERIIASYPNGTPSKIEYYKIENGEEVLVKHVRFFPNGEKQEEGGYLDGKRDGIWTYWHENGNKWSEGFYHAGQNEGKSTVWYENGEIQYSGFYKNDKPDGKWAFYSSNGKKVKEVTYSEGKKIEEIDIE
jgi:antitoxin component YwqK of YwqJK toxin-antitoxin module